MPPKHDRATIRIAPGAAPPGDAEELSGTVRMTNLNELRGTVLSAMESYGEGDERGAELFFARCMETHPKEFLQFLGRIMPRPVESTADGKASQKSSDAARRDDDIQTRGREALRAAIGDNG